MVSMHLFRHACIRRDIGFGVGLNYHGAYVIFFDFICKSSYFLRFRDHHPQRFP
jgi:hypothetical protein